jgi:hypothetical protein
MDAEKPSQPFIPGETVDHGTEIPTAIEAAAKGGADVNAEQASNEINALPVNQIIDKPPEQPIGRFRMWLYRVGIGGIGKTPGGLGGP